MPKKPSGEFDQMQYIADWKKKNMKSISLRYSSRFVDDFKVACNKLGLVQSDVFRKAMQEVIDEAAAK